MNNTEIQNLIRELIEKTTVKINSISVETENPKNIWFRIEVSEPNFFIGREGEALYALNHLVQRIIEKNLSPRPNDCSVRQAGVRSELEKSILIDINNFQKRRIDNIRAVAHMMSERARYFKSSIEFDPMSAFERRIVHEFLSDSNDLKTESVGFGPSRRVVIKYIGMI